MSRIGAEMAVTRADWLNLCENALSMRIGIILGERSVFVRNTPRLGHVIVLLSKQAGIAAAAASVVFVRTTSVRGPVPVKEANIPTPVTTQLFSLRH